MSTPVETEESAFIYPAHIQEPIPVPERTGLVPFNIHFTDHTAKNIGELQTLKTEIEAQISSPNAQVVYFVENGMLTEPWKAELVKKAREFQGKGSPSPISSAHLSVLYYWDCPKNEGRYPTDSEIVVYREAKRNDPDTAFKIHELEILDEIAVSKNGHKLFIMEEAMPEDEMPILRAEDNEAGEFLVQAAEELKKGDLEKALAKTKEALALDIKIQTRRTLRMGKMLNSISQKVPTVSYVTGVLGQAHADPIIHMLNDKFDTTGMKALLGAKAPLDVTAQFYQDSTVLTCAKDGIKPEEAVKIVSAKSDDLSVAKILLTEIITNFTNHEVDEVENILKDKMVSIDKVREFVTLVRSLGLTNAIASLLYF
jgi:hypothetical protein